jgi:hypothetical protein
MTENARLTALEGGSAERQRPSAPPGLKKDGRALWHDVTQRYALRVDELRALEVAARSADELARIESELAGAPLMVARSRGGPVPNPLLEEARRTRRVYLHALGQIGLRAAEDGAVRDPGDRSAAGRALVAQRWKGRHG